MAASENQQNRRQRRQQIKQRQVPQRQRVPKTQMMRSESSASRREMEGRKLSRSKQSQSKQKSKSDPDANWWQQLFGGGKPQSPAKSRRSQPTSKGVSSRHRTLPNRTSGIQKPVKLSDSPPELVVIKPSQSQQSINRRLRTDRMRQQKQIQEISPRPASATTQTSKSTTDTQNNRRQGGLFSPLVYGTRLLILGIGLGVVVGTMLSIWDPANRKPSGAGQTFQSAQVSSATIDRTSAAAPSVSTLTPAKQSREIAPLKGAIANIVAGNPQLTAGVFVLDVDTGAYVNLNGTSTQASASTIKVPILVAFLQDVDTGKISLDEKLTLKSEFIASGSGKMQRKKPGTKYTALETATKMIVSSDNTATHMLIDRLGGSEALNQRFREWGMTTTVIRNELPDVAGTNTTSPKELVSLMARVIKGELLSSSSRDRMLDIMHQTENRNLLPRGLGKEATIAHKTGHIGSMLADTGIVELPNGKRYIAAVMVRRPRNDSKAQVLIQKISRAAYEYFSKNIGTPNITSEDTHAPEPSEPIELPVQSPPTTASRQQQKIVD